MLKTKTIGSNMRIVSSGEKNGGWAFAQPVAKESGDDDKNTKIKSSTITPYEVPKSSTGGIISEQTDYYHPESGLGISTTTTTSFQDELKKYDNSKPNSANYHSYDIVTPSKQHFKSQNCLSDMDSDDLDLKNVAVQSGRGRLILVIFKWEQIILEVFWSLWMI